MTQFLAEMDGWNPATGAVETTRWADGEGFWNEAGDTPPDVFWEPDLIVPEEPLYKRSLFADGRTGGGTQVQISEGVAIRNLDGRWDHLADWGWDGRRFRLWRVEPGESRAEAVLVLSGVVEQLLPVYEAAAGEIDSRLVVRLKDPLSRFDQPIQPTLKYLGTNSGPDGLEGTENDLKGLPKPIAYGFCPEVPARPVNTSLLIYQVADGAVAEISAVYDAGLLLALDADYATPALLAAATPAEGEYSTCVAFGLFMLGAEPFGTVTADVSTVASPLPSGDAVQLNGSTQYFTKSSGVTGAPATDRGVVSAWFRVDGGDGTERTLLLLVESTFEAALRVWLGTDNKLRAAWVAYGGEQIASVVSTSAYAAAADWRHLALAWIFPETGSPSLALWIDAGNQTNPTITGTGPFNPLRGIRVGAAGLISATQHFPGALAELWVAWGQFLDITVSSGRERLRTLAGYPADLGPTGAKPTGISPVFYLRGGPDQFGTNLGTGGNLTGSGGSTVATSTPYAPPPATPSIVTAAEIIRDVATARAGVTEEEIDGDAFDQASLDAPEAVGIWIGAERTVREVLDEVANSAGLAYWWRSDGLLTVGRFRLPSGPPAATIAVAADQISLARQPVTDTGYGLPAYSIVVEHSPIYQVQEAGALAEAVDTARAAYLATEFRRAAEAENAVRDKHPLAPELIFRTRITDPGDAADFAADRLALYGQQRSRWLVTVPLTAVMAAVEPFDVVEMIDDRPVPRFGLGAGKLFRVLGIASAWRAKEIEFDLWGGEPSPIRIPWMGRRVTVHAPTVIGSAATVTVPFLGDRATIHGPRIRLYLRPPYLGNRVTLHAPTVSTSYRLAVPFLGSRATVHAPAVLPGAVAVQVPALGSRATIHEPTLLPGAVATQVPFLGLRATLHGPTVAAGYRVQVPALSNRATVHAPALVYDQAVAPPSLGNRVTVHSPVVQSGNTFVVVPFLGDRAAIHAPTVAAAYRVTVPALGDRVTIHEPEITARATVAVPALGDRATLHEPAVAAAYRVTAPDLGNRVTVHSPTVVPDQLVAVPALGNRATLHQPTLSAAYRIAAGELGNRITIHEPQIITGDLRLTEAGDIRITEAGDARELE